MSDLQQMFLYASVTMRRCLTVILNEKRKFLTNQEEDKNEFQILFCLSYSFDDYNIPWLFEVEIF